MLFLYLTEDGEDLPTERMAMERRGMTRYCSVLRSSPDNTAIYQPGHPFTSHLGTHMYLVL
jgi:hypothetical protein